MSNGIAQRQLEKQNLVRLAAQRYLYSKAKRLMACQLLADVPFLILLSIVALGLKSQSLMKILGKPAIDIAWVVATTAVLITLIDLLFLSPYIEKLKEKAAKIQETFDCDVLILPWNDILVGPRPDLEDIIENANRYMIIDPGYRSLVNWYSKEVDRLPLDIARMICQRSNMHWDIVIREKLCLCLYAISAIMFVIMLLFAIIGELSLKTFIAKVIFPCMPIWVFSFLQIHQNQKAIISLTKLKEHVEKAWNKTVKSFISPVNLYEISRQLQDSLFFNRKTNPIIFDFIYQKYRTAQERSMNYSCEEMIEEYEKRVVTRNY